MSELPLVREEFGFRRTECGCSSCQVFCRHLPGSLAPSDLSRLCPADQDVFTWAEVHLRAVTDKPFPTLVPARQPDGACHWYVQGRCLVHAAAPFGCAFFDSHMTDAEVDRRAAATIQARREDAAAGGLYFQVWNYLRRKGLVSRGGDRAGMHADLQKVKRSAARQQRRLHGF